MHDVILEDILTLDAYEITNDEIVLVIKTSAKTDDKSAEENKNILIYETNEELPPDFIDTTSNVPKPTGTKNPKQTTVITTVYDRDPQVRDWVRRQAGGLCELCGGKGYETDEENAYLEVHHVVPLSDGGPDMITNAVAICETCHGKLHRAKNRNELREKLYRNVTRLQTD